MENDKNKYEDCCWHCIPCEYENFKTEPDDKYMGDIFDQPFGFGSPHWLYRRFHKSYCKAQILANLSEYRLSEIDDCNNYNTQMADIQEQNYSIELLAYHSSLVSIVGSCEIFLKDSFKYFLQYLFPDKIKNQNLEKCIRKYNFQNIESIIKAYKWLFNDFDESIISRTNYLLKKIHEKFYGKYNLFDSIKVEEDYLSEMLNRRHKIVHESYYFADLDKKRFEFYSDACCVLVMNFNFCFIDNNYYEKLDK